jgi:Domain of unknown function (DUF5710)
MRINLKTPFAEKDAAKALGARWDANQKVWYIVDVSDLTPFLRWIPDAQADAEPLAATVSPQAAPIATPARTSRAPVAPRTLVAPPHCGCDVLPWQDCMHTSAH